MTRIVIGEETDPRRELRRRARTTRWAGCGYGSILRLCATQPRHLSLDCDLPTSLAVGGHEDDEDIGAREVQIDAKPDGQV